MPEPIRIPPDQLNGLDADRPGAMWHPHDEWTVHFSERGGSETGIYMSAPEGRDTFHYLSLEEARVFGLAVLSAVAWAEDRLNGVTPRLGSLGQRLAEHRQGMRYDAEQLAGALGWDPEKVRAIEEDRLVPTPVEIGAWIQAVDGSTEQAHAVAQVRDAAGVQTPAPIAATPAPIPAMVPQPYPLYAVFEQNDSEDPVAWGLVVGWLPSPHRQSSPGDQVPVIAGSLDRVGAFSDVMREITLDPWLYLDPVAAQRGYERRRAEVEKRLAGPV